MTEVPAPAKNILGVSKSSVIKSPVWIPAFAPATTTVSPDPLINVVSPVNSAAFSSLIIRAVLPKLASAVLIISTTFDP